MKNVCIIGAGNVGATTALFIAENKTANVVLLDVEGGRAAGKSADLDQSFPIRSFDIRIRGTGDVTALDGADVVVLAASASSDPTDADPNLVRANAGIVRGLCEHIRQRAPEAVVLVVTTPLDLMTHVALETLGFPRERVLGMAGVLDATRFRYLLAQELGVSASDTTSMVLGGHGKYLVPIPRYSTVSGIPITELLPYEKIQDLVEQTRNADHEISILLSGRSACYAPAAAVSEMVECLIRDRKRLQICSVCLRGEYGMTDVCMGVPAILGKGGVEKILELKLTDSENQSLLKSGEKIRSQILALHDERGV